MIRGATTALLVVLVASCGGALSAGGENDQEIDTGPEDVSLEPGDPFQDVDESEGPEISDVLDDCTGLVWYQDADLDGFGSSSMTATGCEGPPGYVVVGGDCDDGNYDVHPGQYGFFTSPYGEGSFDYNCDGNTELQYPDLHSCTILDCIAGEGWSTPSVPVCGESGGWVECELWGPVCNYQPAWRTQGCR